MSTDRPKKRVLVFIDWFLPGEKAGGPVRSVANLIGHLSDEFHFSVVTRDTDYTETKPYPDVQSNSWTVSDNGIRVYYISSDQLSRNTIARILTEEKYDCVYLNGIWSQPFTIWPLMELKRLKSKVRKVVAARGMLAPSALAIKKTKKRLFLQYAKLRSIFSGVVFQATSDAEYNDIQKVFGVRNEIILAGNLPRTGSKFTSRIFKKAEELTLISIARIAPEKNTLYALEVLKNVSVPVQAHFYGPVYDQHYWEQCQHAAASLPDHVHVHFHGAVTTEDIMHRLQTAHVLFLPSRGENFGHIILEALQCGLPVLISDQTPWKEMEKCGAGWDLPLHDKNAFTGKIEALYHMDRETFGKHSQAASALAAKYSDDPNLIAASRKLFIE